MAERPAHPLTPAPAERTDAPGQAIAAAPVIGDDRRAMTNGRIMVVDDDPALRQLIADYLRDNGFDVREARTVAELREAMAEDRFDLIILDVLMPGEDGLSALRGLGPESDAAVIILSTLAHDVDRIVGLELGADDYLAKPCNPRELLARARAVLRRRGAREGATPAEEADAAAPNQGWLLDTDCWTLTAPDGQHADLSTSELRLLAGLAEARGRVLSRDQLMDLSAVGGDSFDRAVDVHISRLRKKLRPMGGENLVRTVRGEGYCVGAGLRCR
jgi:two-component system OmpR family response regulator